MKDESITSGFKYDKLIILEHEEIKELKQKLARAHCRGWEDATAWLDNWLGENPDRKIIISRLAAANPYVVKEESND